MQHLDNKRALVVFSGGQDSTTCLFWAKAHFEEVWALSLTYGQKHVHEVDLARQIAKDANVHFDCMDASFISQLAVPGRNLFFLSIAAVYAHERGIRHLVTGVSQTDFSGYPDCRDNFIRSLNVTLNEALPPVGRYFEDGEQITFGSHKLTVIPTPGHTRGSVCFYCEQEHVMFTGDTLFKGSIGRTDFEGGSMLQIIQSLRMIAQMPDNIVVLSGHGEKTTLGFELAHNPYMDR